MTSDQLGRPVEEVPPLPPGTRSPRRPSMPWLIAALVALLLVVGVVTTLLVRGNRHQSAQPPTSASSQPAPTSSPSASTSQASTSSPSGSTAATSGSATAPSGSASPSPVTPPLLARGKEAPASAIPWSQVNGGWQLADWTIKPNLHQGPEPLYTLYLVNPIGGRYRIATLPAHSIATTWSPDLRRAMVTSYSDPQVLREYDLSTGRQLTSFEAGRRSLLGYAGHSLLLSIPAVGDPGQVASLELVSTAGVHLRYLPASTPQTGPFGQRPLWLSDGSAFIVDGARGFGVIRNNGTMVRQIAFPSGTVSCRLLRWWTTGVALASCSRSTDDPGQNLVTVPIDGQPTATIAHAPPPQYGFVTAWRFSGGVLAEEAESCGPGSLDVLDSAGHPRPYRYHLPAGVSGRPAPLTVYADQVSLVTGTCGDPSGSLFKLNLRTGATSSLLGPGVNGGSVANVVVREE